MEEKSLPVLKPEIPQGDLFLCDLCDAPLKDDQGSMEHPIFTISKKPDMKARVYEHNGVSLRVSPSEYGIATMYDKDVLIYAVSKLMQAKNSGKAISPNIVFEAQEALRFMHRTDKNGKAGGTQFRVLETSLRRLKGTMLETNITTNGVRQTKMFGLIDSATVWRENITDGRVLEWGLKLSDWLYNAVLGNEVLTLHRDYFRLRSPTEKRIYEIARRHCGDKQADRFSMEWLQKKVGSAMVERNFRGVIKGLQATDHLPDYHVTLDDRDVVTFTKKDGSKVGERRTERKPKGRVFTMDNLDCFIDPKAQNTGRRLASEKGWDLYALQSEFVALMNERGAPENVSAAYVGFIRQKPRPGCEAPRRSRERDGGGDEGQLSLLPGLTDRQQERRERERREEAEKERQIAADKAHYRAWCEANPGKGAVEYFADTGPLGGGKRD